MERTILIVAVDLTHTLDNTRINTDEWLRMRSSASQDNGTAMLWLRLRTHKVYTILGTVKASSRIKVKQAAEAFMESEEYAEAFDNHTGVGCGIEWMTPEELAAAIAAEQAKHADLDRKLAAEIKRREQWQNPVKINT